MKLYIIRKGISYNALQAVVPLVQQELSNSRQPMNPVGIQSMRLEEACCTASVGTELLVRGRASRVREGRSFLLPCPLRSLPENIWSRVKVDLPTSKTQSRCWSSQFKISIMEKTLTGVPSHLGFK